MDIGENMIADFFSSDYQSVKDCLPIDDGKYYDVICIILQDNICHGYNYFIGKYCNGIFHANGAMFFRVHDFRCDWKKQKVIAWKPLDKATPEKIREFYSKIGA